MIHSMLDRSKKLYTPLFGGVNSKREGVGGTKKGLSSLALMHKPTYADAVRY